MSEILVAERSINHETTWVCDKWSQEAVDFSARELERMGIERTLGSYATVPAKRNLLEKVLKKQERTLHVQKLVPVKAGIPSSILRMLVGEPEESLVVYGNGLLNEGIQLLENLSMVASGLISNQTATNYWSNTNSYIGVGTSSTAFAATQTDLQGTSDSSNRAYKVMNATYPTRASQTVTFVSDFATAEGNFVWAEWSIAAGATTAGAGSSFLNGTTNLNRKVDALGTKASGTWTLTCTITFS